MSQPSTPEPPETLEVHPIAESPEAVRARKVRNWILAGALLAFVILVFVVTIVRLGGHVMD